MRLIGSSIVTASALAVASLLASTSAHAQSAARCADLAQLKIAPAEIGLPSGGAAIASAQMATVPADPKTPGATRDYCKVLGAIAPVDPNAPPVNFQVNLPLQWNGKAVQYGGGGYNGNLVTGLNALPNSSRRDTPVPIARGFATWGTDSGHDASKLSEIQAFALNEEALINYAYASYKKTRDAARRIAIAFYDRPPLRIYYYGNSEGGREGLTMAQRFPADFDGVVSIVPVIGFTALQVAGTHNGVVHQNGGWLNSRKIALLGQAVVAACDSMDGLADGIISAYEKCVEVFDPKTLHCTNGVDAGDQCLSDAQIIAVETLHRPYEFPFALANGVTTYPGWNYGGENQQQGGMVQGIMGTRPAQFPVASPNDHGVLWNMGNGYIRYFIARDLKFDPFRFAPRDFADRIRQVSEVMDSTNPDLSAFLARGGKLILKENAADFAQSPFQGIDYYRSVVAKLGQAQADRFIRFYVMPGANHVGNAIDRSGAAIPNGIDLLGVLDEWVDSAKAPDTLIQVSQQANPPFAVISSRPMCRYPLYPRYNGRGDPKQASSFTCTPQ